MMTDIRRYKRATIESAARGLNSDYEAGDVSEVDFALELNSFCVRDFGGTYWFHNPKRMQDSNAPRWFRFEGERWHANDQVPEAFEAPDLETLWAAQENGELGPSSLDQPPPEAAPAADVMSAIVEKLHAGFENGTLSSTQAEQMLAQQFLLDLQGGFWTKGFRSQDWFCFRDQAWNKMPNAPVEEQLLHLQAGQNSCGYCGKTIEPSSIKGDTQRCPYCNGDSVFSMEDPPEKIANVLPDFLMLGLMSLPEPIADDWEPPASFPPEVVATRERCPACNALVSVDSHFCNQCGCAFGCPSCGTKNPPGNKCCAECGTSLVQGSKTPAAKATKQSQSLQCSKCGSNVEHTKKFCTHCGTPVTKD